MHRLNCPSARFLDVLAGALVLASTVASPAARAEATSVASDDTANVRGADAGPARPGLFGRHTIPAETLGAHRGGALTVVANDLTARGTVSDNFAANLSTGNNAISDSAFQHAAGLPMVIQNSGNNVLIQNSTILNLNLK